MNTTDLKEGVKYVHKEQGREHTVTYTGTSRYVKKMQAWFFCLEDNSVIFMYEDDVKKLKKV